MYTIVRPKEDSPIYIEYLKLVSDEWPENQTNDEFSGVEPPIQLITKSELVGGLTFTRYKSPEEDVDALWINSLYIKPRFRGNKLASHLLSELRNIMNNLEISEIFVYTSIPQFYLKHGWLHLNTTGRFSVLKATKNVEKIQRKLNYQRT